MYKKLLLVCLCSMLIISIGGCNKGTNSKGEEVTTLKVFMIGNEENDNPLVIGEVNKLLEKEIGVNLDWNLIATGSFTQKMSLMMASSETFDICFTGFVNPFVNSARDGAFLELNQLIDKEAPKLKALLPQYLWDAATIDGKIYAVPNQQINAVVSSIFTFESYAKKYNIDASKIKNTADLEPYLEQVKQQQPDKWAYRVDNAGQFGAGDNYEVVTPGLAIKKGDPQAQLLNYFETPEYLEGVKITRSWFEKGYIRQDIASVMDDNSDYLAGKYVFSHSGWGLASSASTLSKFPGEKPYYIITGKPYLTTDLCDSTMLAISRTSKNPKKAIKYIETINTNKEIYNLLSHGIEGKHYTRTDNDHIKYVPKSGYAPNHPWAFGNQFNSYVMEGNDVDIWDKEKAFNLSAEQSPLLGFRPNKDNVTTEMAQVMAVVQEFKGLDKGSADVTKAYPQMIERLKNAGLEKIKAEYQKQINEFLAKK